MTRTYKEIGKNSGGGDPNILKLKDTNKIRPLDNVVADWRQHGIEHPTDPEQFTSVVCPGPRSCPLCRKPTDAQGNQRFGVSRRYAANVWDYDTSTVKVLIAGPQVFDEFQAVADVGIDPAQCDWTILKEGQRRGTKYTVIRHDASPLQVQVTPDMLHDVAKYEQPDSPEAIFEKLEKFGIDYDSLTVPSYTYDEALAFCMPYTSHKGKTVEQLVEDDQGFAVWLHGVKLEQGQLGDPVFLALQAVLEEQGVVPPLEEALSQMPEPVRAPAPEPQVTARTTGAAEPAMSVASANMVRLISATGEEVMVPPTAVEPMLQAGFVHPTPEPAAEQPDADTMEVLVGGQPVTLPAQAAQALLATGQAQPVGAADEPEPALPLPDEMVDVKVNGTAVQMQYVTAAMLVDAGTAEFTQPAVARAHARVMAAGEAQADPTPTPGPEPSSTTQPDAPASDPEKPFVCDTCGQAYKTRGGLTQHNKRQHPDAEVQPPAAPNQTNGASTNTDVAERVKAKIASAPFARDYERMVGIFEEETGERNFTNMDEAQLLKLEARIEREVAAAASAE